MPESEITTRVEVTTDTSELDTLPTDGVFECLSDIVNDFKQKIEDGAKDVAEAAANTLMQYKETYFNEHDHPFETGEGQSGFRAESESELVWVVDNVAENRGFPYMVTEELGTNPGRELEAHPFAAPAREDLESDVDTIVKENIDL